MLDTTKTAKRETVRQYADRRVRELAAEYGLSLAEVRESYPLAWWSQEWWAELWRDVVNGAIVDRRALDSLDSYHRYRIAHDYPQAIPAGYVNPEAR